MRAEKGWGESGWAARHICHEAPPSPPRPPVLTSLTLYPAIDLKDGHCVRLRRGEMDDVTIYADNPAKQAQDWQTAGSQWLHVVDLNGAFQGKSVNESAVLAILESVTIPVQLGGGLRDLPAIERWLAAGLRRVILGSAAVKNPDLVKEACRTFPNQIVIGIDARDGFVATEGWAETSTTPAPELAKRVEQAGATAIIYTDIARDGMLSGLNLEQTVALADSVSIPVIASGGVGNLDDLRALRRATRDMATVEGVIVGRALYDGRMDVASAMACLSA